MLERSKPLQEQNTITSLAGYVIVGAAVVIAAGVRPHILNSKLGAIIPRGENSILHREGNALSGASFKRGPVDLDKKEQAN